MTTTLTTHFSSKVIRAFRAFKRAFVHFFASIKLVFSRFITLSSKQSKNNMGKGNKKSKGSTPSAPKCTCDHPYKCSCGNRPERPSKGHKWDPETQQWGGKGHKQKGASGQTSTVGQEAKITSVGKTQVAQWQRLPSQLLREVCQKQKRPPPKFKEMLNDHKKTKFKVRCLLYTSPSPRD